ncbi:HD domain-containing protein [Bacillus sp. JJ722]
MLNEKWNVTNFEHSKGVMLLIRILGGSVEEQVAGLLHDVSYKIKEIFLSFQTLQQL